MRQNAQLDKDLYPVLKELQDIKKSASDEQIDRGEGAEPRT